MEEKSNYYIIIPSEVRYDNRLKDKAKLLFGEILALSNKQGYCFASNNYFAKLYGVSSTTISLLIKNLIDTGYIKSEIIYREGTQEILKRYLKILKEGYLRNLKEGIKEKLKDNNTSNNNINNNKRESEERKNTHPSFSEVQDYIKQKELNVNPKQFYDYFEAGDWRDKNGNEVLNWKQKLLTWNRFEPKNKEQMKEEEIKARNERFLKGVRNNDTR